MPSNSANYFHVLRRQIRRDFRKPLILFNSKRLLKYKKVKLIISTTLNYLFLLSIIYTNKGNE